MMKGPCFFKSECLTLSVSLLSYSCAVGQEDYDRLRPLSYPETHVVLVCFSIDSPESLENVRTKWIDEVRHYCEGLPIILVGCKSDLRSDPVRINSLAIHNQTPVSRELGTRVAEEIGARMYLECSAKTGEGIYRVFDQAARAALTVGAKKKKSFKCLIQ